MRKVVQWGVAIAALSIGAPPDSRAADDPAARDAQARFDEGLDRVKTGDYEAARISFAQAYAVLKRPAILWNLALAEEKTGRWVDALSHFKRVVRDANASSSDRDDAERHANGLASKTGHIDMQAPPGATLRVDGDAVEGVAPFAEPLDVMPGHHQVDARLADASQSWPIDVVAGQVAHLTFDAAATTPPGVGSTPARVESTAPAPVPSGPPGPSGPSGAPDASSSAVSGTTAAAGLDGGVSPDGESVAPEGLGSASPARVITVSLLGGAALVALGIGITLGLASQDNRNQAATERSQINQAHPGDTGCSAMSAIAACRTLNDDVHAENRDAAESNALYVTAGALAVGGLAAWFLWPRSDGEPKAAWIAPAIGPSQVGIRVGGNL
jgi:hypothetical protein